MKGKGNFLYQDYSCWSASSTETPHVVWGTQLSYYCLSSTFPSAGNCLSTSWCTCIMRLLHLWNNHHTARRHPWDARHSRCSKPSSTVGWLPPQTLSCSFSSVRACYLIKWSLTRQTAQNSSAPSSDQHWIQISPSSIFCLKCGMSIRQSCLMGTQTALQRRKGCKKQMEIPMGLTLLFVKRTNK